MPIRLSSRAQADAAVAHPGATDPDTEDWGVAHAARLLAGATHSAAARSRERPGIWSSTASRSQGRAAPPATMRRSSRDCAA
ncbi:hypothetical protein AB4Z54_35415 [Streptomyces sp. MCAF7]